MQPTITITWDEESQSANMRCEGFKNLDFPLTVLDTARAALLRKRDQVLAIEEEQQRYAQQDAQRLMRKVKG